MRTGQRKSSTGTDLQIAVVRWLAYVATALGLFIVWLVEPSRVPIILGSTSVLVLIVLALLYNAIVTVLAYARWLERELPIATLVLDCVVVLLAYFIVGYTPDLIGLAADPLLFFALLPVVTASVRFHWGIGLVVAAVVSVARTGILLWGLPDPLGTTEGLLLALFGAFFVIGAGFLSGVLSKSVLGRGADKRLAAAKTDVQELQAAIERAKVLQQMTSMLSSTLNFERVLELALDVAERAMADWGAKGQLVAMIFLFERGGLRLAASRHLPRHEWQQKIRGQSGVVARCLEEADLVATDAPNRDPELAVFTGLGTCRTAAALPLRAGFENYGAIVFATPAFTAFDPSQLELFSAIAAQATIALHNALLYQNLQNERDKIVAVEEEARHKLSRDLHDGPTQGVSAIAMRLNYARKMLYKEPPRLLAELELIEKMARQTVKEIRHMLFTLRPLVLETQGLLAALQTLVDKLKEADGLNVQIRELGDATMRLDVNQAGVLFYIIEEALGNARKYSQASLVEVRLWVEDNLFVAQVADNGVGFDTREVLGNYESRGSLGMVNMRERAELIDGSLDVKSAPGRGTTVTLVVPIQAN